MAKKKRRAKRQSGPERRSSWRLVFLLLPALSGLVYLGALRGPFVYDDLTVILGNPSLRRLQDVRALLLHDVFRPVLNLSYALDFRFWGENPLGFHLSSIVLHVAAACLLASLLRRALEDAGTESGSAWLAAGLATVWGVHPLLTESVAYVSGRSEVLCGVFFLASLVSLRRSVDGGSRWRLLGIGAFLLALASKEVAAALPMIWLLWELLLRPGEDDERRARVLRFDLPLLGFVVLAGMARLATLLAVESTAVRPWGESLAVQVGVAWRYLGLFVVPVGQSIVPDVGDPRWPMVYGAVLAWIGLGALALRYRREAPLAAWGLGWWLLLLAPSSLVPLAEAMAEHRSYLAAVGPVLALAELLCRKGWRSAAPWILGLLILVLAPVTVERVRVWSDPVLLWEDAAAKAPAIWASQYGLGEVLRERKGCEEAIPAYRRAVALLPDHELRAHMNLGICLAQTRRFDEAEAVFLLALKADPDFVKAHNNLGQLYALSGRSSEAQVHLERALALDPGNVQARIIFAAVLERSGDASTALSLCREAAAIAPAAPGVQECVRRLGGAG